MGNGDCEESGNKNDGCILNHIHKENVVYGLQRTLFLSKAVPYQFIPPTLVQEAMPNVHYNE